MFQIAYIDDEIAQLEYGKQSILTWNKNNTEQCKLTTFSSPNELIFDLADQNVYQLLILDIEMTGMNGMELAKEIRKMDAEVPIVFLTNRSEYVFEGYEVRAMRYLLKPLTYEKIAEIIKLCMELEEAKNYRKYLIIPVDGEKRKIYLDEIFYAESKGHYVCIYRKQDEIVWKENFSSFTARLSEDFVSTHRSFVVNLRYVDKIAKQVCTLEDERNVPISRNEIKKVNESFIRYNRQECNE